MAAKKATGDWGMDWSLRAWAMAPTAAQRWWWSSEGEFWYRERISDARSDSGEEKGRSESMSRCSVQEIRGVSMAGARERRQTLGLGFLLERERD